MTITKHTTTEYNRFKRVEGRFRDAFSRLVNFKETQAWYHGQRKSICASSDYQKLSRYYLGVLSGQEDARRELLQNYSFGIQPLTEYRFWFGGEWRSLAWLKAQRKVDADIDRRTLYEGEYRQAGYFWVGSDKPYWIGEKEPVLGALKAGANK